MRPSWHKPATRQVCRQISSKLFFHMDYGQRQAGRERHLATLSLDITTGGVERHAGEGGTHLQALETGGSRSRFTDCQDFAPDPAPRPRGMHKKSTNLRRLALGIKQSVFATGAVIAAIECPALAPAPATGKDLPSINLGLGYKVGAVLNQLRVHAKDALQSELQLLRRIVFRLEPENGLAN